MMSDLQHLKTFLRLQTNDVSTDSYLSSLIPIATGIIQKFCKQTLETAVFTDYRDGQLAFDIALAQKYVRPFLITGNLTQNSTTISNVSSTSGLVVGAPLVAKTTTQLPANVLPNNTVISAIPNSNTITMSQAALVSATAQSIVAGFAAWYDPLGRGGFGPGIGGGGPYGASTMLLLGSTIELVIDQNDGSSKCGCVRRTGFPGLGGGGGFGGWGYGGYGYGFGGSRGGLTARLPPDWGNTRSQELKVVYQAGVGIGAPAGGNLPSDGTQIPTDLTYCCNAICGWIRGITPQSVPIETNSIADQISHQLSHKTQGEPSEVGTVRNLLLYWRDLPMGR